MTYAPAPAVEEPVADGDDGATLAAVPGKTPPPGSEADILARKQRRVLNPDGEKTVISNAGKVVYKVQFLTADRKLPANSRLFKGYKDVDFYVERGVNEYTYGETTDFNAIRKIRRTLARSFKDAFIVAFKDGKKVKY